MKKFALVVAVVAVAVAAIWMFTNKSTVAEEKVTVKEVQKSPDETVKTTMTTTTKPGEVKAKEKTEYMPGVSTNKGYLKECVATFERVDEKNMHAYFIKDKKMYRLKFPENMKENVLKYKKGDKVHIWSTYPLDAKELAKYSDENKLQRCESAK